MNTAETYQMHLIEVRGAIRRLEASLAIHARRQSARPADWGFAGDLENLARRIREITPTHTDRRCEWKHPRTCGAYATISAPDGRILCLDHAVESNSDPRDCLNLADGSPVLSD